MVGEPCFTLKQPKLISQLMFALMGVSLAAVAANLLFAPPPHTGVILVFTVLVFIPCTLIILWAKLFKIEVRGTRVSVQRAFGMVRHHLDVSEITRVKYRNVQNQMGLNQKMTLYTSKGKIVSAETLMVNFEMLDAFIKSNVCNENIQEHTTIH